MPFLFSPGVVVIRCAVVSLLSLLVCVCAFGFDVTVDGKPKCVIVTSNDPAPFEQHAADELADYIRQSNNAKIPIVKEREAPADKPQILVGSSDGAKKAAGVSDFNSIGEDGIVMKLAGDKLVLAGGGTRGTIYAVETFLEDVVGVRWWTSVDEYVPKKQTITIDKLDVTHTPKLRSREVYYYDPMHDLKFAVHAKLNGHMSDIPASMGGHYQILGWCHTSFMLLPPDKYFEKHPDWYSLQGEKRDWHNGQLCWSNPEMRAELLKQALEWIKKNPDAGFISISQNDCIGNCQCDKCKALDDANGSPAGSLIAGINAIAAEIGKQYPNFLIETLAYQYSRKPPKDIKPADNVLVRLCSIEADFAKPLDSASNKGFADDLKGWSKIAKNLFVWNYVTNFNFHLAPHPSIPSLGPDLKFFADHNVVGVFEQGDGDNRIAGDLLPYRVWLMAKLMWDPSLDQAKLTDEFVNGYYGPAGSYMKKYIELTQAPAKNEKFHAGCFNQDLSYLTPEMLKQCHEAFDAAEAAVLTNPGYLSRVKRDRLVLELLELQREDIPARIAELKKTGADEKSAATQAVHEYEQRAGDWAARAVLAGMRYPGNYFMQPFETYATGIITRGEALIPKGPASAPTAKK
jgi:hypothetical protein